MADELDFTEDRNALYRLGIDRGLTHDEALRWAAWCVTPSNTDDKEEA